MLISSFSTTLKPHFKDNMTNLTALIITDLLSELLSDNVLFNYITKRKV